MYYTGNQSAEAAASYVFDNPDIDVMPPLVKSKKSRRKQKNENKSTDATGDSEDDEEPMFSYKMVFVVNTALNMGIGKIASQVAHACLGIYKLVNEFQYMSEVVEEWEDEGYASDKRAGQISFEKYLNPNY